MAGELIIGKDLSVPALIVMLGATQPGLEWVEENYQSLARELGVEGEGEGGQVRLDVEAYVEWMRSEQVSLGLAVNEMVRAWVGKKEGEGEAPKLEELLKAMETVGVVGIRDEILRRMRGTDKMEEDVHTVRETVRMTSDKIIGKDVTVLKLVMALKRCQPFPEMKPRFEALANALKVSLLNTELKQFMDLLKKDEVPLEYAVDALVRKWAGKKGKKSEDKPAGRLETFMKALEAIGLVDLAEALGEELSVGELAAGTSLGAESDNGGRRKASGRKRKRLANDLKGESGSAPEQNRDPDVSRTAAGLGSEVTPPVGEVVVAPSSTLPGPSKSYNQKDITGPALMELFLAIQRCDPAKVKELLQTHAAIANAHDACQLTSLHLAAETAREGFGPEWLTILQLLLDHGADPYLLHDGMTFLHRLLHGVTTISPEHFHNLVEFLVSKKLTDLFNVPNNDLTTPFHSAVNAIDILNSTLELLHKNGVNFNALDKANHSVLKYAMWDRGARSTAILSRLVDLGVKFTGLDRDGRNLLHHATRDMNLEALKFFIGKGLDVNEEDMYEMTPLGHVIVGSDKSHLYEWVKVLVEHGAEVRKYQFYEAVVFWITEEFPDKEKVLELLRPHASFCFD